MKLKFWLALLFPVFWLHADVTYECPAKDKLHVVSDGEYRGPLKGWKSGREVHLLQPDIYKVTVRLDQAANNRMDCQYWFRDQVLGVIIANTPQPVKCPAKASVSAKTILKSSPPFQALPVGEYQSERMIGEKHENNVQYCTYQVGTGPMKVFRVLGAGKKCTPPQGEQTSIVCDK